MYFEIYEDCARKWRWRLRTESGLSIAESASSFADEAACRYGVAALMAAAQSPVIVTHPGAWPALN